MCSILDHVVNLLADEAAACINCLESNNPPSLVADGGMPLTDKFFGTDISFMSIYQQKYTVINEIKNFLSSVCSRIFPDLLYLVLGNHRFVSLNQSFVIPDFSHPTFSVVHVMPRACDNGTFGANFVEIVIMHDNIQPHKQHLFTKLVLHSVEQVYIILSGCRIAKFKNNGKHIWARKYESQE
ncbi:uncharacterized protein LOC110825375 [Carica papaya]|uniref:uncharacterized protein LOC110825375 n=1 Tax=Carica papaya TaxID=3649 RepID=UPI000B8D0707|nr:uncharacterized protein LOC110825375 [Carica papaya]